AVADLEEAARLVERADPSRADGPLVRRELLQAIRLARHGAWRLAREAGVAAPDEAAPRRDPAEASQEQRACWLLRSRPGGLADSVRRLEKALATYGGSSSARRGRPRGTRAPLTARVARAMTRGMAFERLFSPLAIGPVVAPNRVVF